VETFCPVDFVHLDVAVARANLLVSAGQVPGGKMGWMTKHHKNHGIFEWEKRRVMDSMGQMRF